MRGAPRAPLPALPGEPAGHREVLPRVRDTGSTGGVRTPSARAALTRPGRRAPRRAPPADGPLQRSRWLNIARAAARRRGLAGRPGAVPRRRLRRRGALGWPRRQESRRWTPHLLRLVIAREDDPERAVRAGL